MKCTGVGGKRSETKRSGIARRPPNRVSYEGRSEGSFQLSQLFKNSIHQKKLTVGISVAFLTILYQHNLALHLPLSVFVFFSLLKKSLPCFSLSPLRCTVCFAHAQMYASWF